MILKIDTSIQRMIKRWPDQAALLVLLAVWALFFWRFLTPVEADQVSLAEGDFSGQFVAFGAYQAARLWQGEVPLWNPYNNGGLPFLADTQSAVFYPPRLLTVVLAGLGGGWTYHALELEMMAHVLAGSLGMYIFVRRLTVGQVGSVMGGLGAALVWAYGGFMTGYPPLQLALLEAAIWGPLALLGVHEATREAQPRWRWLAMAALGLGLSVLAGHSQTNLLIGYLTVAFWVYRVYARRWSWKAALGGVLVIGIGAVLLAAVQLLPAFEYLLHATRIDLGFEAKQGGFPIYDVIQAILPGVMSVWSPLYVGVIGLLLAGLGLAWRVRDAAFWGGAALIGLVLSFGGNTAFYGALYNALPGLSLFRGQERAALVVALAASVLAGLGLAALVDGSGEQRLRLARQARRAVLILVGIAAVLGLVLFVMWLGPDRDLYGAGLASAAFTLLLGGLALVGLPWLAERPDGGWRQAAVIGLLAFDLLSFGQRNLLAEPVPANERLARPAVLDVALADPDLPVQRVDGRRGLLANYGSLWEIPDIRGISPLWLAGPHAIVEGSLPETTAWELFAVKYVFSDWMELPIPSTIVASGEDGYGPVNAHRLDDPRPFALLLDRVDWVDSDAFAYALLADSRYDPRRSIILLEEPGLSVPDGLAIQGETRVTAFAPEAITIAVTGQDTPAVLSIALPNYPGWQATIDGQPVPILRAYGALSAVSLPAGARQVELVYRPLSFAVGAALSLAAWVALIGGMVWLGWRRYTPGRRKES